MPLNQHEILDQRSLAFDRLIARKLRANPMLAQQALATIERWLANPNYSESNRQAVLEWKELISTASTGELATFLESDHQEAQRMRQSSPFCDVLSSAERNQILKQYEPHRTRTHSQSR